MAMMLSVCASSWGGDRLEGQPFTHSFNKRLILTSSLRRALLNGALEMGKIHRGQRRIWIPTNNLVSKTNAR